MQLTKEQQDALVELTADAAVRNDFPDLGAVQDVLSNGARLRLLEGGIKGDEPPGWPGTGERASEGGVTLAALKGRGMRAPKEYPLPGVGVIWVHPFSQADRTLLVKWSAGIVAGWQPSTDPAVYKLQATAVELEISALQVCLVARQGPERKARLCFKPEEASELAKELGEHAVTEIAQLSERLARPDLPEEDAPDPFDVEGCLTTLDAWHSAAESWETCPPGLRETTQALMQRLLAARPLAI